MKGLRVQMSRYLYSLVRCVPNPRTGEFVNYGAIVGDPASGDWSVRWVSNERHVQRLADATVRGAVHSFLSHLSEQVEENRLRAESTGESALDEAWLRDIYDQHRNVVQLSAPSFMIAPHAEEALDIIFNRMIIDPVTETRPGVNKHRVLRDLREAYRKASIDPHLLREKPELYVGGHVHTLVDFAIGNGRVVQVTQAWSFQRTTLDSISTDVKSWAYALGRLRTGEDEARVVDAHRSSVIDRNVDLEVVIAPPETSAQQEVYGEAEQIFEQLDARMVPLAEIGNVGARATELLELDAAH
jgi:hypothetical protein